jgi:hypothetical protein
LTVVQCHVHGCGFTLYPPGYAPYRSQPVVKVSPDGSSREPDKATPDVLAGDFAGTIFEAAVDGETGRSWARDSAPVFDAGDQTPDRWWSTQGRHLRLTSRLLGVARELCDSVRAAIASTLSVVCLERHEAGFATGYRAISEAVCHMLRRVRRGSERAMQLLVCGHLIGQWGEPLHWDATRQVLRRSPCRAPCAGDGATTSTTAGPRIGEIGA